jgi:hypothetical protein
MWRGRLFIWAALKESRFQRKDRNMGKPPAKSSFSAAPLSQHRYHRGEVMRREPTPGFGIGRMGVAVVT